MKAFVWAALSKRLEDIRHPLELVGKGTMTYPQALFLERGRRSRSHTCTGRPRILCGHTRIGSGKPDAGRAQSGGSRGNDCAEQT